MIAARLHGRHDIQVGTSSIFVSEPNATRRRQAVECAGAERAFALCVEAVRRIDILEIVSEEIEALGDPAGREIKVLVDATRVAG